MFKYFLRDLCVNPTHAGSNILPTYFILSADIRLEI